MINGLPPQDVPRHLREPRSCKACRNSFYAADDLTERYLRCSAGLGSMCTFVRDEDGTCGPESKNWKPRETV